MHNCYVLHALHIPLSDHISKVAKYIGNAINGGPDESNTTKKVQDKDSSKDDEKVESVKTELTNTDAKNYLPRLHSPLYLLTHTDI